MRSLILMASRCPNLIVEEIGKSPFHKNSKGFLSKNSLVWGTNFFTSDYSRNIHSGWKFCISLHFLISNFLSPFLFSTRKEKFPC